MTPDQEFQIRAAARDFRALIGNMPRTTPEVLLEALDAERARSERMARVINVADMMRGAPVDERRDRWDIEYDAVRAKVEK